MGNMGLILQRAVDRETKQCCWRALGQTGRKQNPANQVCPGEGGSSESFEEP